MAALLEKNKTLRQRGRQIKHWNKEVDSGAEQDVVQWLRHEIAGDIVVVLKLISWQTNILAETAIRNLRASVLGKTEQGITCTSWVASTKNSTSTSQ